MSDVFRDSVRKKKRTWGDWFLDNVFTIVIICILTAGVCYAGTLIYILNHVHDIAREAGGVAKSFSEGYQGK